MDDFEQKLAQAFETQKEAEDAKVSAEAQKRWDDAQVLKQFEAAIDSHLMPVLNASKRQAEASGWRCTVSRFGGENPKVEFKLSPQKVITTSTLRFTVTQAHQQMDIQQEIEGSSGIRGPVARLSVDDLRYAKVQELMLAFFERVFEANR